MGDSEAVHSAPVWRDRSNFIITAPLDGTQGGAEQLWARRIASHSFQICCVPFFLYDIALGDIVVTDDEYVVREVVQPSGRYVFRVWFEADPDSQSTTLEQLVSMGAELEWSSPHLVAVDAANRELAQRVAAVLEDGERKGNFRYETGRRRPE